MSDTENPQQWVKEAMSKVIENLGPNLGKVRYDLDTSTEYRMSDLYYVCLKFTNKTTSQSEELSIILKRPVQSEIAREKTNSDAQFNNEILFYQIYARPDDNFARCFYADERPPADSVIALENVTKRGYHPSSYAYDPPLEYTLAAMRELGRFHGKGYVMKELQREKFCNIVKRIQEVRYGATSSFRSFINKIAVRPLDYLRGHGCDAAFCDKMESVLSNAFDGVMRKMSEPLNPLSTLCHGDFAMSNVLFKTEDDGQYRAILIDFALLTYGRPVIDLSTYLCAFCSNEVRKEKFSEIIRAYHDALKDYLLGAGVQDIEKYSYDAFVDDYKTGSLFGFVIAVLIFPAFFSKFTCDTQNLESMSFDELAEMSRRAGGEEVTKKLADLLLELRDSGCLKHLL